jgi:hypothetical protein
MMSAGTSAAMNMRLFTLAWILMAAAALPPAAAADEAQDDRTYFGVSMLNMIYATGGSDHRSTGLVGRFGYDLSRHLAVETHFGGSIGAESNADSAIGRAQMDGLYSLFLRYNGYLGTQRLYGLAGMSYGQRVLKPPGAVRTSHSGTVSGSLGLGLEIFGNRDVSFDFEVIRYFDRAHYSLSALNLGLLARF